MKIRRTCREATHLLLESQDRPLPALDRLALRLHWLACEGCRGFRDQTRLMQAAMAQWRRYRDDG
jgi:hypothetical protein